MLNVIITYKFKEVKIETVGMEVVVLINVCSTFSITLQLKIVSILNFLELCSICNNNKGVISQYHSNAELRLLGLWDKGRVFLYILAALHFLWI